MADVERSRVAVANLQERFADTVTSCPMVRKLFLQFVDIYRRI
jgi:hypothetical protein